MSDEGFIRVRAYKKTRVASRLGHVVLFEAGEEKDIPASIAEDAFKAGCVPLDSLPKTAAAAVATAVTGGQGVPQYPDPERASLIGDVVKEIVAEGNKNKLKSDGMPRRNIVQNVLGFEVTQEELDAAIAEAFGG